MPSNYAIRTFFLSSLVLLGSSCASYDVDFEPRYFSPKARIYFDLGTDDADEVDLFQDGSVTPTIDFVNVFWSIHKSSKKKAKDAVALYDRQMELVAKGQFDAVKKSELENLIKQDLRDHTERNLDEQRKRSFAKRRGNIQLLIDVANARIEEIGNDGRDSAAQDEAIEKVNAWRIAELAKIEKGAQDSDVQTNPRIRMGPSVGVGITSPAEDSRDRTSDTNAPSIVLSYGWEFQFPIAQTKSSIGVEVGLATGWSSNEGFDDVNDTAAYVGINLAF